MINKILLFTCLIWCFENSIGQTCESSEHQSYSYSDQSNSGVLSADLNWTGTVAAEEYQVNYTYPGIQNVTLNPTIDTAVTITALVANTVYSWRVRVKCGGVWGSWPAWQDIFTTPNGPSCEAINHSDSIYLDQSNNGVLSVDLSWAGTTVTEEYQVNYTHPGIQNVTLSPTTDTTITIAELESNTEYSWRVRTKCGGIWGEWPGWQGSFTTSPQESSNVLWQLVDDNIFYAGSVGIGSDQIPTGYQLSVDGKILAEEVNVQLSENWPDYVFDTAYPLKPIEEIEKYIMDNKHLPGIPTATEVVEEGVDVGYMNTQLLMKIEELMLYIIQEHKENQELRSRVQILEKKLGIEGS